MSGQPGTLLPIAEKYAVAGFSVLPVKADGSKAPAVAAWKQFQTRQPTPDELRAAFGNGAPVGIALIHGAISGNSEVLDFDAPGLFEEYAALCADHGLAELLATLPLIETPSGGRHLLYRCEEPVEGNQKLARDKIGAVRIETRGEGGYTLAPGSPPACHPDGKPYLKARGNLAAVPTITAEERRALLALAHVFNEYADPATIHRPKAKESERTPDSGLRPGDDFNERGDPLPLLLAAGWQIVGQRGETILLRRPGKARGISATYNFGGSRIFFPFTTSAPPFEAETSYPPFSVYGLLKHGDDFAEAARQLGREGYGDQTPPAVKRALRSVAAVEPEPEAVPPPCDTDAPAGEKAQAPANLADFNLTDAGNAERLIQHRGPDLRFVRRLGWRTWNGRVWEAGEEAVMRLARETMRALLGEAAALLKLAEAEPDKDARRVLVTKSEELAKHALRSEQTAKLRATVEQAKTFAEITVEPALFNLRPWIVPFANGVWDQGEWRNHQRGDYAERLLPVAYEPDADRGEWNALMERITGGDAELAALLQEVAGYAFSGASSLRILPWLYGPKGAGKSTFAELLQTALGASGKALDWSLVSGDRTGEELGRAVRGARAVFLPEAGKKRLDPEILKLLSGSDSIPCRELYQGESFTVPPTWALVATSNDPPNLTAYDDALKDRVKALPFVHKLADGPALHFTGPVQRVEQVRRDPESPLVRGFVAWAVEGLSRVHRNQAIRTAEAAEKHTRQFWADTDPLTPFWAGLKAADLRDRRTPTDKRDELRGMKNEALRSAYLAWCDHESIKKRLAGKAWADACDAAGLKPWRSEAARGWFLPDSDPWPYENDGMTESSLFSEKSPIETLRVEGLPETAIIPSFRHFPSSGPADEADADEITEVEV